MIIRERGMYSVNLNLKDFQNIVRWKASYCEDKEESMSDTETQTKIAAIMIFLRESMEQEPENC